VKLAGHTRPLGEEATAPFSTPSTLFGMLACVPVVGDVKATFNIYFVADIANGG